MTFIAAWQLCGKAAFLLKGACPAPQRTQKPSQMSAGSPRDAQAIRQSYSLAKHSPVSTNTVTALAASSATV
ncbi:MAG: hypothetical protein WCO04_04035, partial [Pseudomonadota bacterium]